MHTSLYRGGGGAREGTRRVFLANLVLENARPYFDRSLARSKCMSTLEAHAARLRTVVDETDTARKV